MTVAEGRTRQNITVVDTLHPREMHLRRKSDLASEQSLRQLNADLGGLVHEGDICVFAGAMPAGAVAGANGRSGADLSSLRGSDRGRYAWARSRRASSRPALPWLISPNVEELRELLGCPVEDTPEKLAQAGRKLLDRMDMVLISRGERGALIVARGGAWTGRSATPGQVLSTVGCGDYLLAGFLAGVQETDDPRAALTEGLKVATARAWGWTESESWARGGQKDSSHVERV